MGWGLINHSMGRCSRLIIDVAAAELARGGCGGGCYGKEFVIGAGTEQAGFKMWSRVSWKMGEVLGSKPSWESWP